MQTLCTLAFAIMLPGLVSQVQAAEKKVKVFILAGQSNMESHGQVRSLDWLGQHPKYDHLLKKLKNTDGSWAVREDVTIAWTTKDKKTYAVRAFYRRNVHSSWPFRPGMERNCLQHRLSVPPSSTASSQQVVAFSLPCETVVLCAWPGSSAYRSGPRMNLRKSVL